MVILRYIFPSLVPTQAKLFSKLIIGGVGITLSGVENFQQINYRGGGGRLFGSREYFMGSNRVSNMQKNIFNNKIKTKE